MNIWHYFQLGGFMMWPLLACSVLLLAILVERGWTIGVKCKLLGLTSSPDTLLWHRRVLPFFTDLPPSLGLLGTVIGVVQAFQISSGRISGEAVGAGLGVACMTTVYGLSIAIVASIAGYVLDWAAGARPSIGPGKRQTGPSA